MGKRFLGIGLFLVGVGLVAAVDAAPKPPPNQPAIDADKLAPGVFTGTVVSTPDSDRMLTLNVTYQKVQLRPGQNPGRANQNLQRQYNHIVQLQNQLARPGRHHNPVATMHQLQNAVAQLQIQAARTQANMYQTVTTTQKVDFQVEENVKVRTAELPQAFDDKGEIKKYTKEELKELKGADKNLPGYESSIDNLKVGQTVQVTLAVHKKPASKPAAAIADKDKEKDKDSDADKDKDRDTATQHKMQVRMIVILKESDAPANSTTTQPKKKNK
jgi:hypothetical protein